MDFWFVLGLVIGGILLLLEKVFKGGAANSKGSNPFQSVEPDNRRIVEERLNIEGNQFRFRYEPINQGYQVRTLIYPPIRNPERSRKASVTHVYSDGRICVTRTPETLEKARAIARFWATGYVSYIKTGVFPNGGGRVDV